MNLDASTLVALASLATAIFVGVAGWRTTSHSARKDEVSLLREEIARLHQQQLDDEKRITQLEHERTMLIDDISVLWQYAATLRALMIVGGVKDVPAMPTLRSVLWNKMNAVADPKQ